ncbi:MULTISPECIES: helix-turn-helix transcriptional regulator [unclassified Shinella]|uniref:helix-turn-helix transcriptional regulator n=1 Tax=unclassified Shinella TaxID=2643062 RepID=UPI0030C84D01
MTQEQDRFIDISEVCRLVGLQRSKLYQMIRADALPKPIKLGGASRWSLIEINAWMSARRESK